MFETVIAICIALDIHGAPVSRGWLNKEGTRFESPAACLEYAQWKEATVAEELIDQYGAPPVVSVVCGQSGEDT